MAIAIIWLVLGVLVLFSIGYLTYSRYLAQFVELDDSNETPAHKYEDGQEYVPAKKPVLLGHHYSSIAGGAPIVGPITAGVIWGWIPALLWIAIGNPLLGATHDFISLSSSLRHEGKSIGHIIGEYVGERGKNMLLWFAFLTIILVVAVFAFVVGVVFEKYPSAATASMLYIALAVVFGVYLYQLNLPFGPGTVIFVIGVFASVFVGQAYPIELTAETWVPIVLLYAFIASVLPVWTLLQPRDYLSSFLLYAGVGGALLAVIVGTIGGWLNIGAITPTQPLTVNISGYNGFWGVTDQPLFPLLFITIACGTISGFHSLVSSGTTSKQLNKESDARVIGYGGMLGEGLLATLALASVALVGKVVEGGGVGQALPNFATGGGIMLTSFGIDPSFGAPFMALVMVSFLLTSTDTALRLGRYMFEEIVGTPETQVQSVASNRYFNAGLQCVIAYALVASGTWSDLWPLFGGANQLLAALALLTATVWLANWDKSKQLLSTGVPMAAMTIVTILGLLYLALYQNIWQKFVQGSSMSLGSALSAGVQTIIALVLVGLALSLVRIGYANITSARNEPSGRPVTDGGDAEE
ncbi:MULTISPECIES: carbon starvation protein A [unclassified Haladaptatus]|uniref:carbon starvation CstA family protein n=1 Tax=unclassified Haladaptatus TaxID=2622732 RepID=UPI00209BF3A3|nr:MULTISPECIES: carbon starvation protein A [unclassified Haladaptatus]MCO8242455.1 carbon starvation protein A [Haladaptatus sp. AB643]MCO8252212.1 carbon starvation protein A [Haladaptatus sp. AB618]